jgi:hypothetical protein
MAIQNIQTIPATSTTTQSTTTQSIHSEFPPSPINSWRPGSSPPQIVPDLFECAAAKALTEIKNKGSAPRIMGHCVHFDKNEEGATLPHKIWDKALVAASEYDKIINQNTQICNRAHEGCN